MSKEKARIWPMNASEKLLIPANVTRNTANQIQLGIERNLPII